MRKISTTLTPKDDAHGLDGSRPLRVPGATITAWNGAPPVDLTKLFAPSASGPTVNGAELTPQKTNTETVCLLDGTEITFSDAIYFNAADVM